MKKMNMQVVIAVSIFILSSVGEAIHPCLTTVSSGCVCGTNLIQCSVDVSQDVFDKTIDYLFTTGRLEINRKIVVHPKINVDDLRNKYHGDLEMSDGETSMAEMNWQIKEIRNDGGLIGAIIILTVGLVGSWSCYCSCAIRRRKMKVKFYF